MDSKSRYCQEIAMKNIVENNWKKGVEAIREMEKEEPEKIDLPLIIKAIKLQLKTNTRPTVLVPAKWLEIIINEIGS